MNPTTGVVMTLLAGHVLRDEVDRVAAAVGVRVIHADASVPSSRRTWSAAAAVVLDEAAARRCGSGGLPRRARVIMLTAAEPVAADLEAAIAIGAQQVLTLPRQEAEFVRELSDAGEAAREDGRRGEVIAVVGGRGGAGSSLFATALAYAAPDALLVDLDPWGGGLDLLLGSETIPGLRWPDLAVQNGRLNWAAVREALPRCRGMSVLSGTRRAYELTAGPVTAIVDAGRRGGATVICDLPRRLTEAVETALDTADLVVLVSQCDVRACAATAATAAALSAVNPNIGLVVRGPSPGGLRAGEVAKIAGLPLLASMRPEPLLVEKLEHRGLRLRRRSPLAMAARRVLAVLQDNPTVAAA